MNALREVRHAIGVLVTALALVFVTTPGASAAETQGLTVRFSNDVVQGTCALNVTNEDPQTGAVTATIGAGASAVGWRNYLDNAFTQVECKVFGYDSNATALVAEHEAHTQGPLLLQNRKQVTLTGFDNYVICGQARVRQRDGSVHHTHVRCER